MNSSEEGGYPLGCRRRRGEEGQLRAALLESAVGHETMEMHAKAEVTAKTLDYGDDAAVKRRDRGEPVLMLDRAAYVLKDRSGEALRDRGEGLAVVAETNRQVPREGEHPLAVADRRQNLVHEKRGAVGRIQAGSARFLRELTLGSIGRVLRNALLWTIGFAIVGIVLQLVEVSAQSVSVPVKVLEFVAIILLFPLAGLISGVFWGVYRSLIIQVETVEEAVETAIAALLAKVREAYERAGDKLGRAIGADRFAQLLDDKIGELVATSDGHAGGGRRLRRRISSGMLRALFSTIRAVTLRALVDRADDPKKPDADDPDANELDTSDADANDPDTGAPEGRRVTLSSFVAFMENNAFSLVFDQLKARIALLRIIPLLGLLFFVALPILIIVLE